MIRINNLTIIDDKEKRILVKDLSFLVNPKDKVAIIGEEGNGKSVLLKTLLGQRLPLIENRHHRNRWPRWLS